MGSIEQKYYGIKEDNFDVNTAGFLVGISHYESFVSLDSTMLGVSDSSKVGE